MRRRRVWSPTGSDLFTPHTRARCARSRHVRRHTSEVLMAAAVRCATVLRLLPVASSCGPRALGCSLSSPLSSLTNPPAEPSSSRAELPDSLSLDYCRATRLLSWFGSTRLDPTRLPPLPHPATYITSALEPRARGGDPVAVPCQERGESSADESSPRHFPVAPLRFGPRERKAQPMQVPLLPQPTPMGVLSAHCGHRDPRIP